MSDSTASAYTWAAVTPSNTAAIEPRPDALFIGGGGNVSAVGEDGVSATFAVADGAYLMIQPVRINATGTTATGIVALYN